MKLASFSLFLVLVACGGTESSLFDLAATTTTTDPIETDAAAPTILPNDDASADSSPDVSTQPACVGFAEPNAAATCHACSGTSCQANGCFGGWYCNTTTFKCVAKPDGC
jgi:hypothetical protein